VVSKRTLTRSVNIIPTAPHTTPTDIVPGTGKRHRGELVRNEMKVYLNCTLPVRFTDTVLDVRLWSRLSCVWVRNDQQFNQKHQTQNRKDQHLNPGRARNLPTGTGENVMKVSNFSILIVIVQCIYRYRVTGYRYASRLEVSQPRSWSCSSPFAGFGASSKQASRYSCGNEPNPPPKINCNSRGTRVARSCNRAFSCRQEVGSTSG